LTARMQATPARKPTTTTKKPRKAPAAPAAPAARAGAPTHEEIARRAYELYEQSGFGGGRDVEFWAEAERQLRQERTKAAKPAPKVTPRR